MRKILLNSTLRILAKGVAAAGGSLLLLLPVSVQACDDWVAKLVAVEGLVQKQRPQQHWQPVQYDNVICPGERLQVGANSRAALHLRNNTFTRVDADSIIHFPAQSTETRFWIELQQGMAHFISRIVHQFEVATPYVNAVVEGTEFIVSAQQQGAVSVLEGKVTAYNESGRASLEAGQQASAPSRQQPPERLNVPASTLVEWAIYYPPVLTLSELPGASAQEQAALQQARQALDKNRIDLALQALDPASASSALQLARAALLLQLGRMDEFQNINSAQLNATNAGLAHALQAIADVARNRLDTARHHADEAISRAPEKAASWIALSYVQQGALQLDDAMASADKATRAQPDSVLARLRLSELYLAQGNVDAAHDTLATMPANADSHQAVLSAKGFVELFRLHPGKARQHFESALAQNSANPQNHLGLGLTLLRDGELEQGRQQIEYAVSLDPLRSVLRSYLGRAYFEEKRAGEAVKQWELAKQFDSNDPTPYFYTGVHKLFANDPVGAIDELETSRELNDKRALYRSETLLQSDAASRSATLARAYNEVGYSRGVLLNGWDAVRRDPASAEGHRLLADHYAGDPRYETARVSELLQSQLWQPLSAYPLQPQLSEADISVVAGAGPQRPGLNEYHSLFTQDGAYGSVNGYGGSDGTWADDLVGSVLAGPIALSLGQYHFESDGWRDNADQEQDVYSGLVQWQAAPDLKLQAEYRDFEWDQGDLSPELGDASLVGSREHNERRTSRIGITKLFSPRSAAVVSLVRQEWQYDIEEELAAFGVPENGDFRSDNLEWQWVYRGDTGQWIVGAGHAQIEGESGLSILFSEDLGFGIYEALINQSQDADADFTNGYVYYSRQIVSSLTFSAGLAYYDYQQEIDQFEVQEEFLDGFPLGATSTESQMEERQRETWLPKLGVMIKLTDNVQVRTAYFHTIARPQVLGASIEPTAFTGFNQVFDDLDSYDSENVAVAFDVTSRGWKWGGSFVRRLIDVPVLGGESDLQPEQNESIAEGYVNVGLGSHGAFTLEAARADRKLDESGLYLGAVSRETRYAVPATLSVFLGDAYALQLRQSYFRQSLDLGGGGESADEEAWTTDVVARYRMPARLGSVAVGINNLFDEDDSPLTTSAGTLAFYPGRFVFADIHLNF